MLYATKQFASLIHPYLGKLFVICILILLQLAFALAFPLGLQLIFDNAIPTKDITYLLLVLGWLLAGFIVSSLSGLGQDFLAARIGADSLKNLRIQMFDHLHSQSAGFYSRHETGDLMSRFSNDLNSIESAITTGLPMGFYNILLIISTGILLFFIEWHLALAVLIAIPLVMVGPNLFGSRAVDASYKRKLDESELSKILQENLSGQAVINVFGLKKMMRSTFISRASKLVGNTVRMNFFSALVGRTANSSMYLVIIIAIGVGAYLVIGGYLTTGAMLAFITLLLNLDEGTNGLSRVSPVVIESVGALRHISEVLDEKPEIVDSPESISLPPFSNEIHFKDVSFSYTGDDPHLDCVSLDIKKGESVAFVGSSGSGKSTMFNLITGSYRPNKGEITFDDVDIRGIKRESLNAMLGVVFQDSFLFNTSIMENIRYGRLTAGDQEVMEAAKTAEVHDFIMGLPEQYETLAGQGGDRLSGGQRQRIAIARALLRNPKILVMDEATSALDPVTESEINNTLHKLAEKHTIISITHRLDSVVYMDKIFVMDRGKIVEQGNHDQLLALGKQYYRLWNKQSGFHFEEKNQVYEIDAMRLRSIPFLQQLDDSYLEAISSRFMTSSFESGTPILSQGESGKWFYIIVRGSVNIQRLDSAGNQQQLSVLEVGDYFGEISLITDVPVTASVVARTPTTCLTLAREQFNHLLSEAPELKDAILPVMQKRLQELSSEPLQ